MWAAGPGRAPALCSGLSPGGGAARPPLSPQRRGRRGSLCLPGARAEGLRTPRVERGPRGAGPGVTWRVFPGSGRKGGGTHGDTTSICRHPRGWGSTFPVLPPPPTPGPNFLSTRPPSGQISCARNSGLTPPHTAQLLSGPLSTAQGRAAPHREFSWGAAEPGSPPACEGLEFLGVGVPGGLLVPWEQPDLQLVSPSRLYPLGGLPDLH